MKLLITMAGKGTRFRDAGVSLPKHEIPVKDRPMFDWAMESLQDFFEKEFTFITQSSHETGDFLASACERLGIHDYREVKLNQYTSGQAATAMEADDVIADSEAVAIYNIDTYVEPVEFGPESTSDDGCIPVFKAPGERWSFIQENADGYVKRVSEKEKISDLATVGFYYFDRWSFFTSAYRTASSDVEAEYGERYVAPIYNQLIRDGRSVTTQHIDADAVHVLGTPDDLKEFDPEFNPDNV